MISFLLSLKIKYYIICPELLQLSISRKKMFSITLSDLKKDKTSMKDEINACLEIEYNSCQEFFFKQLKLSTFSTRLIEKLALKI